MPLDLLIILIAFVVASAVAAYFATVAERNRRDCREIGRDRNRAWANANDWAAYARQVEKQVAERGQTLDPRHGAARPTPVTRLVEFQPDLADTVVTPVVNGVNVLTTTIGDAT